MSKLSQTQEKYDKNLEQTPLSLYRKKNLPDFILIKNSKGHFQHQALIYKHHASGDIHYFKCQWERRKKGGNCPAKFASKEFDPEFCKEGDNVKVYLVTEHSDDCPTVPTSQNHPDNKMKDFSDKANNSTEAKNRIINYLEEHPEKTSNEIMNWMQTTMELHLQLQITQIQNIVYSHRKELMIDYTGKLC